MSSGKITLEQRKASLHYHVQEYRKRRVIIDTDAACEADDPFAIAQALMSKMLEVKGICAEHFVAEGSMEQSYEMICRVTEAMGADVPVLRGQTGKMSEHQGKPMTEAAQFIIEETMKEDDKPLFVLCIGAVTNVAEAIRAKSEIVVRMTVVCIGGNPIGCEKPGWEFNFGNDVEAANTVLHCWRRYMDDSQQCLRNHAYWFWRNTTTDRSLWRDRQIIVRKSHIIFMKQKTPRGRRERAGRLETPRR